MLHVKLSDKPCLFCSKAGANLEAKSKAQSFLGVVCPAHLVELLQTWERRDQGERGDQAK